MSSKNLRKTSAAEAARKRAAAKELIERYYHQLTDGCGNSKCTNKNCASNVNLQSLKPEEAAVLALQLFKEKALLCASDSTNVSGLSDSTFNAQSSVVKSASDSSVSLPNISSHTEETSKMDIASSTSSNNFKLDEMAVGLHSSDRIAEKNECKSGGFEFACSSGEQSMSANFMEESFLLKGNTGKTFLNEASLLKIIEKCQKEKSYSLLIRTLGHVFSDEESLKISFLEDKTNQVCNEKLTKEDMRAMEVDEDKDKDSKEVEENPDIPSSVIMNADLTVDIASLRRAFSALFSIPDHPFQRALINALLILSENLEFDFKYDKKYLHDPGVLNIFIIIMEIPMLECPEYLEAALPAFCKAASMLTVKSQAKLAQTWGTMGSEKLKDMVITLNQFITYKVISGSFTRDFLINDEESIVAATKVMKILYFANIVGGEMDHEDVINQENEQNEAEDNFQDLLQGAIGLESKEPKQTREDPLSVQLGVKPINCRKPIIRFEEFYNEPLSDQIEMDKDYTFYKNESGKFSFMNYSFILTPAVKSLGLYYDNRIRMYNERRISVFQSLVHGDPPNPYLRLRVRRDHIIDDALVGLEMVAMENPSSLKKQLVVEFEGEQGIDEGGLSKEFFQLVVEEVFNPDFAMFSLYSETQTYWFNPTSFESDAQFTLIGIILGLAIYNNIILDVHFPMVVYRKLMGKKGTFHDLSDWNPTLSRSLVDMMEYQDDDMEQVFLQPFRISYQDVFGSVFLHDLKDNGDQILVNQANKHEFVQLYADFLLNKCVEKQFRAFRRGFQMVTDDSPLKMLFRPEEVELLVCGSQDFDFVALEEATEYDGGYMSETPIIRWFWELVHEFSSEQKKKLLQFATGSDRVPVGGLSKLKLVIARHGPDSDRLPTAHTCFNVLLLPEYHAKEKLEDRLLKAINYSKGFGML